MGRSTSRRVGPARLARAPARRRSLRISPTTQLAALKLNLDRLDADLRVVKDPVDELCRLIAAVKKPLTLPGTLATHLTDLRTLLEVVNGIAAAASWLPAPAGPAARALTNGLKVFLGPPKPGALTEMIDAARAVDKALAPARRAIEKLEKPAAQLAAGLGKVDATLLALSEVAGRLIARHGDQPPAEIEACARRLNDVLGPIAQAIDALKREALSGIAALADALRALLPSLEAFSSVVQALQSALAKLAPLRDALLQLKRALKAVERVRKLGEKVVKALLKKLGLDVDKIERWMNAILQHINPFKSLARVLERLVAQLQRAIAGLPGVDALLRTIGTVQRMVDRLHDALEDFAASECGRLFGRAAAVR